MKELLQQYAAYNVWAHQTLSNRLSILTEAQITSEIISSFPSVYKTMVHLWQAESIWWQRLQQVEKFFVLSETFNDSFSALTQGLLNQSQQWQQWVDGATEADLNAQFAYVRNNQQFTIQVKDMLLHIFNHATLHRGQLITFLRQLGALENIPSTDFATYCRVRQ